MKKILVADDHAIFREGLKTIDRECTQMHGHAFLSATPAERLSLLERLDREQFDSMQTHEDEEPALVSDPEASGPVDGEGIDLVGPAAGTDREASEPAVSCTSTAWSAPKP